MKNNNISFSKTLSTLSYAMGAGQIIFLIVAFIIGKNTEINKTIPDIEMFTYIVPLFLIGSMIFSSFIFTKKVSEANKLSVLSEKLALYRTGVLIRCFASETTTILSIFVYMFTGRNLFVFIAILSIYVFFKNRPSKSKIAEDLDLSKEEIEQL
ncbi:MAG: hypothetical protein JXR48_16485 [Candidatus Delongbacteria bacterium]|nr:hypothetical protein [Candidatus Delongbacteria bacterium]MBN2836556.1 hypothetical protein [Candidatus Delongbacteria bacterium]